MAVTTTITEIDNSAYKYRQQLFKTKCKIYLGRAEKLNSITQRILPLGRVTNKDASDLESSWQYNIILWSQMMNLSTDNVFYTLFQFSIFCVLRRIPCYQQSNDEK
ncbi:uncharacterized protein LOC113558085 [Rhopalosiphum maidis]|uniref:uncharacterized protein LOC113558085 n=1 Tax=Rhopalosiphum maidis TaxID=43146 RepID=UPI000EFF6FC1|nr:uncharacterized protein LOC113558085 [Rhopalosiphum maidis]